MNTVFKIKMFDVRQLPTFNYSFVSYEYGFFLITTCIFNVTLLSRSHQLIVNLSFV